MSRAAEHGVISAQTMLGIAYQGGIGVQQDDAKAMRWHRLATDQGDAEAQTSLGEMYPLGRGTPQNYAEAFKWIRRAADLGFDGAQFRLGVFFENGQGVPRNNAAAVGWYRRAADQGLGRAQVNLGFLYAFGTGVAHDFVQAHIWFTLAGARLPDSDAQNRDVALKARQTIAATMTAQQLAEAQRRAAEWRPKVSYTPPTKTAALPTQTARPSEGSKKPETQASSGTGFFVTSDGKALTNAHVVQGCRDIGVVSDGQNHPAKVLARDERNDLALIATDLHPVQAVSWRLQVRQGEDIVVYGFPLLGALASGGNVTTGNVTALAGLADDSRYLQISAPVQPGNSGGPLVDRNGSVVGVIVSKLNALSVASVIGDIPQNVNFAIKASVAAAFLDAQRVAHAENAGDAALATPDIAERAQSFTVKILCR
jgi:S1-C subfamily serine protease